MTTFKPISRRDWTDEERKEIGRLQAICENAGQWELECSHTDAGDPWCIIYDRQHDRILLHIARIDRRYVVVAPLRGRPTWTAAIAAAIDLAIDRIASEAISQAMPHPSEA